MRGKVELYRADLSEIGSYDAAFLGCCAVIHAGAALGHNKETPQQVYDGCFTENRHVLDSVKKAGGTIKRFVFTSSFAAVGHPRPEGYVFTEKDWCGDNIEAYKGAWTTDNVANDRNIAYAMAKANTEKFIYESAASEGSFEAAAICPIHVLGPLQCSNHDQAGAWQAVLRRIAMGKPYRNYGANMLWNIVDVRDVAKAHRLCAESTALSNGSRYILSASDRCGELFTWELQSRVKELFPGVLLSSVPEAKMNKAYDSPRAYCLLAKQQLGLEPYSVDATIRETLLSYLQLGLLKPDSKL